MTGGKKIKILSPKSVIDKGTSKKQLLSLLLKNRHVKPSQQEIFLTPPSPKSLAPSDFGLSASAINQVVARLKQAVSGHEPILIYGDYDVDGITATALLWQALHKTGADTTPFIPHREKDGYGLNDKSFFRFQRQLGKQFSLLVTVDNGIVAHDQIKAIKKASDIDVMVIDHHEADKNKLAADFILHSTVTAGSALSWLVSRQLDPQADLGLAALGTVADCLPLIGVNRSLLVHGLQQLRLNPSVGIKRLIKDSGVRQDSLGSYDLGFIIGPRINAAGRLSDPTDALRLLCSTTVVQAQKYSQILSEFNRQRQSLQQELIQKAQQQPPAPGDKLVFLADESFHPGIIGLIAGRLTEQYALPSVVISTNGPISKGSCRSIEQLNIIAALRLTSEHLLDLGGHQGAAGFTIKTKKIPMFQKAITQIINQKLAQVDLRPEIEVDARMSLAAANLKNFRFISTLEPFGIGNPRPRFLFENLIVVSKRLVGSSGDHLKLKLDDPSTSKVEYLAADAIAFRKGEYHDRLKIGSTISVAAELDANTWNGATTPQLLIKEIFPQD